MWFVFILPLSICHYGGFRGTMQRRCKLTFVLKAGLVWFGLSTIYWNTLLGWFEGWIAA